jgi:hypothetical protein
MERQTVTKVPSAPTRNHSVQPKSAKPSSPVHWFTHLQRSIGNQATQRLIKSHCFQAKLSVSSPEDPLEEEADQVADTVMRMPDPSATVKPNFSTRTQMPLIQRKCSECEEEMQRQPVEEEQETVQAKTRALGTPVLQPLSSDCRTSLQRTASSSSPAAAAPSIVHDVLRSTGHPLDASTRAFMEPRFGRDFSGVRVHTDVKAVESAESVNARSYAVGGHLVFGRGEYRPGSTSGMRLLAHELTHVVQQGDSKGAVGPKIQRSRLRDFADINRPDFDPSVLTDAQIEATNEFRAYMDPTLVWQVNEHMTRKEARLACRMILTDIRAGVALDWQTGARIYMNRARALALPDTGLARELGFELDPSSRPPSAPPPPPPPVGGPPPPPPPAPPRIPWDGAFNPAAANPAIEALRAFGARATMMAELFTAYDAYLTAFRPAALRALANRVPFNAPAPAVGAPGPAPTGVVDIANQARDVLEARYGTTMDAAAPTAAVTAGRLPRTTAAGAQNIFEATSEADRSLVTGAADLAPGVAWWLFENDRPGVRARGASEFASVILGNHHYSPADDPGGAFRWAVANAYAAAATLAPNNRRQLIDYRLTGWSEAGTRGFTLISSFDPGANPNRAELEQRWQIFKTATHESLHLRAHPVFTAAEQGRGAMAEGFTEMFTVSTLNTDVLPRARVGRAEPLRRVVEGALSPPAPDATLITNRITPAQYTEHLAAAERIRDGGTPAGGARHIGVGEAAVRAAFFQGHVEYIGLAPGGAQAAGLRAAGTTQQTRIPGGIADLNDLALRTGVPRLTILADNPGITDALPPTAVLRSCLEHQVVPGESRANIAAQHGVAEADLVRANPDVAVDPITNQWPPLAAGQRLLIPAH